MSHRGREGSPSHTLSFATRSPRQVHSRRFPNISFLSGTMSVCHASSVGGTATRSCQVGGKHNRISMRGNQANPTRGGEWSLTSRVVGTTRREKKKGLAVSMKKKLQRTTSESHTTWKHRSYSVENSRLKSRDEWLGRRHFANIMMDPKHRFRCSPFSQGRRYLAKSDTYI